MRYESETLKVGDRAPRFDLATQRGQRAGLDDYLARGPVLLAFHRGTWCPNCRRQFGELAHNSPLYAARGVQVVAVVCQQSEKVRRYIEEFGLPFNILVDEARDVVKLYGVWHRLGLDAWNIARPSLFVIDRQSTIKRIFVADTQDEFPTHEQIVKELDALGTG